MDETAHRKNEFRGRKYENNISSGLINLELLLNGNGRQRSDSGFSKLFARK